MEPENWKILTRFRSGDRFLWWKFLLASLHLTAIISVLLLASFYYPGLKTGQITIESKAEQEEKTRIRQLLLETLDYIVRYQHYYRELYGSYARNIRSLGIPESLVSGTLSEIEQFYEISVLEATPRKFLVLAVANPSMGLDSRIARDRITMDENYRIQANFTLPLINKKFIAQEAERVLQLKMRKKSVEMGITKDFWKFEEKFDGDRIRWVATGLKGEIKGAQRYLVFGEDTGRGLASIFSQVKRQLNSKVGAYPQDKDKTQNKNLKNTPSDSEKREKELTISDLRHFLSEARFAQYIHFRERGFYAEEWDALDRITSFQLVNRATASSNVQLETIEFTEEGFAMRLKGVEGDLLGELFSMNEAGEMKQIRYSDVLVRELQQTSEYLPKSFLFQISEVPKEEIPLTGEKIIQKSKRRTFLTD